MYNTSNNELLCGYHHNPVFKHITITCPRPLIGRYVHFKKKASVTIEAAILCEVIIIGHKYIGKYLIYGFIIVNWLLDYSY